MTKRKYLTVWVRFRNDGLMLPRAILWDDGRHYIIDKVKSIEKAAARKSGGQGDRYTVVIGGKLYDLFFEHSTRPDSCRIGRWFLDGVE